MRLGRSDGGGQRWLIAAGVALFWVLLGWAENLIWLGAIVREFAIPVALGAAALAAFALCRQRRLAAAILALSGIVALWPLAPLWTPVRTAPARGPMLRVAAANLGEAGALEGRVRSLSRRVRPDMLAVVGATRESLRTLDATLPELPFRVRRLGPDRRQALWTRHPVRGTGAGPLRVRVGACDVQVVVPSLPSIADLRRKRERQTTLRRLEATTARSPAVWLGTLGSRPEAADLAPLFAAQRLRDSRPGHGFLGTAPASLGPLGRSTDHVLVGGWVAVHERDVSEPLADGAHATVTATLEITDPRCREDPGAP